MSARARTIKLQSAKNGAPLGFEAKLWATADALRGSMDAAEYRMNLSFASSKP
jgi:type I restriction-modification system DNA methylase subunit